MAKRKKKYNPMKGGLAAFRAKHKNLAVMCLPNNAKEARLINLKTLEDANVSQSDANMIIGLRHRWLVTMAVFLRPHVGDPSVVGIDVGGVYECTHFDLTEMLNEKHQALIHGQNSDHTLAAAWVASPFNQECSTETIDKLFTKHEDVWNKYITPYEHEQNKKQKALA